MSVAPGEFYHIVARGNERNTIFRCADDYARYADLLFEALMGSGVSLSHYVLMPNHIHLLARAGHQGLSRFMMLVQSSYAKHYRKKYGNVGHVWQGRFKNTHVMDDPYLIACGSYIELNPVRAGLINHPEDWLHSSYRTYAYGEADSLIDLDPVYQGLSSTPKERQEIYRRLIRQTRRV